MEPLKGLKLYYLFDFGDKWIFEIQKLRNKIQYDVNLTYPYLRTDNKIKVKQY